MRRAAFIGALGVVFGDIGTSPIYTIQTVFNPDDPHPVDAVRHTVFGVVSLVVWSVLLIVTLTYVLLVMRADNDGEGGIMALITLVLFLFQRRGTETVGRLFGPVMIAWFLTIAACGIGGIADNPEILRALSPTYALSFLAGHFHIAFFALAAVVLAASSSSVRIECEPSSIDRELHLYFARRAATVEPWGDLWRWLSPAAASAA